MSGAEGGVVGPKTKSVLHSEIRIWQSAEIEVVGDSTEIIISEIRHLASKLFKKFTIYEIKCRLVGTNSDGEKLWVGQATVMEGG